MNFRELLVPLSLALVTTWAIQYFFNGRKAEPLRQNTEQNLSAGMFVKAPKDTQVEIHQPLKLEVNFLEKGGNKKPQLTTIETEHGNYVFSSDGASLDNLEFKRKWGGKEGYLNTIFAPSVVDREQRCFLVALDEHTPYSFDLVKKTADDEKTQLIYEAQFPEGTMTKEFLVYKHEYRIDLTLTVAPAQGLEKPLQPRIFFPAPLVPQLGKSDWIKGIVSDNANKVQTIEKNEDILTGYWVKPSLFGTQDRYFINALYADHNGFIQRAYYKIFDLESMYSILEGFPVSTPTTWKLSFYFGPKEDQAIKRVDERLTHILNYGWFSVVSRPVSKILLDILNFINDYVHNYGIAIILLTLLMKLLMLPFTFRSDQGMKKRTEFQKKLTYIQAKYKNDKAALDLARAELVRKHGVPGLTGCLPLLMQIPLFIALSWVLNNSIELYMSPFLWIKDLSAADPYYILPILLGVIMLFNPSQSDDPNAKLATLAMAVIFPAFMAGFPAGLVLYILTSTVLGILQVAVARRYQL
jgi:YidC/Oxa1 family membrane protein insertase